MRSRETFYVVKVFVKNSFLGSQALADPKTDAAATRTNDEGQDVQGVAVADFFHERAIYRLTEQSEEQSDWTQTRLTARGHF